MRNMKFEKIDSVNNPNSIHGMYPYRGKISAIDAEQVVKQLPKDGVLLDPFCGSGTIVYEAQKRGIKAVGVDLNPLAVDIARAKIYLASKTNIIEEAEQIVEKAKVTKQFREMPQQALKYFHLETAKEIMRVAEFFGEMSDYIKAIFYGSVALTARGCNDYKWTSSTVGKDINPKTKIDFYEKFINKAKKHFHPIRNNGSKIFFHDARRLTEILPRNSIDYVFTSPPYFNCLDYTAYYAKIIYAILEQDRLLIKNSLIQSYRAYAINMKTVLNEINAVCRKKAIIIFVVGDKKIHGKVINGGQFFKEISPFDQCRLVEREYTGSSSQIFDKLNKTKRKEQIIMWTKQPQ